MPGVSFNPNDIPDLSGKVILVTGGTFQSNLSWLSLF